MEIIKVVILTDVQDIGFDIKSKITEDRIVVVGFGDLDQRGIDKVLSLCPHIVIIASTNNELIFDVANKIYFNMPYCITMLMTSDINIKLLEKAMSTGIKKVLDINSHKDDIKECIKECYDIESTRKVNTDTVATRSPGLSRVISVFGGKGGIGKTTIAVNVATSLAMKGKKVIVIDSNLQMGDVHLHLDCDPKDTLGELVYEGNLSTVEAIKSFITTHPLGVHIIASPKSPEYSEAVRPEHLESIINTLRPYYDYIIIDLPPTFVDYTLTCFENSDKIMLVVGLDISSIRGAKISIPIFEKLRQIDKLILILNKQAKGIIGEKDVERVLGRKIDFKICENNLLALQSLNKGNPIVNLFPNTPIGKQLKKIADGI